MSQSIPLICAMAVTVVARMYAALLHERPYCYIIAGLMILVPGGVGVRGKYTVCLQNISLNGVRAGMTQLWSGNASEGLQFTFRMINIGVSLAIGVFVGEFNNVMPYRDSLVNCCDTIFVGLV
jgi:uncharacterized membrane protein YjjB (DUF3815 family)